MYQIARRVYDAIQWHSTNQGVDVNLVYALIKVESDFDEEAVGDAGKSFGLGQLHVEGAGGGYKPSQLLDVNTNVRVMCQFLRWLVQECPTLDDVASAYNQGLNGWRLRGKKLNQPYVNRAMMWYDAFAKEGVEPCDNLETGIKEA